MKHAQTYSERAIELGLNSRRPERLAETTNSFLAMGNYAMTFLQQVIDEQEVLVQLRRVIRGLCLATLLLVSLGLAYWDRAWLFGTPTGGRFLALVIVTTLGLLLLGPLQRTTRLQTMARAMILRCGHHSRRSVDAMIDLLGGPGQRSLDARSALTNLLPRLDEDDTVRLNHTHEAILKRELSHQYTKGPDGIAFTIALLYALPRIGNRSFIAPVEKLLRRTTDDRYHAVYEAAKSCLDALGRTAGQQTLLRPSSEREAMPAPLIPIHPEDRK